MCREMKLARKKVCKMLRSDDTGFGYRRETRPQP
jgi:hypothetical protein